MSALLSSDRGHVARHNPRQTDVLAFPKEHPEYVERDLPLRVQPGVWAGELYPVRSTGANGVLLPDTGNGFGSDGGAAARLRPDCAIVLQVGAKQPEGYEPQRLWRPADNGPRYVYHSADSVRWSSESLAESLEPGDRVMVRPWSGVRFQEAYDVKGLCFFGKTDPWEEDTVLRLVDGAWRPLHNWLVLKMDLIEGSIVQSLATNWIDNKATVLDAGPYSTLRPGMRVVCSDDMAIQSEDDPKWLTTSFGPWSDQVWLVREVDCHGVRRVVAKMED